MSEILKKAHRILGALVLGGTADALGWRNESVGRDSNRKPLLRLQGWAKRIGRVGGYWDHIDTGEYSDDTQLTLAVARCLSPQGEYDADRFITVELPYWLSYERGGGRTVRAAARNALQKKVVAWDTNIFEGYYESGANGAAMRIFPLGLIPDKRKMTLAVWQNALATHGHPRAIVGACVMAHSVHTLLRQREPDISQFRRAAAEALSELAIPDDDRVCNWLERAGRDRFTVAFEAARREMLNLMDSAWTGRKDDSRAVLAKMGCFEDRTKGSGTACVAAAHHFFFRYENEPIRAILDAANMFGSDTDTIAKLCGDLLGCVYGRSAYENDFTESLLNRFYLLTIARYLVGKQEPHWANVEQRETDITETKKEGDEYHSRVFGPGIITAAKAPRVIRKGTTVLHQVKVEFQCGMACTFSRASSSPQQQARFTSHDSDNWK